MIMARDEGRRIMRRGALICCLDRYEYSGWKGCEAELSESVS